jgi:hypothetical protein
MGGACGMALKEKRCIQGIGREALRRETILKT